MSGFLLYSPISIISVPVSLLVVNEDASIPHLTTLGIILTIFSLIFYLILLKIVNLLNPLHSLNFVTFFIIPLIVGIFRGCLFYEIVDISQLDQPSSVTSRILGSTLTTIFWLPLANYVINSSKQFRTSYQGAMDAFLYRNVKAVAGPRISKRTVSDLNAIETSLKASVSQHLGSLDNSQFLRLSEVLTKQINEEIKPLSERVWVRNIAEYPKVHFFKLLNDAIGILKYSQSLFLSVMGALALLSNLAFRPFTESSIRTVSFLFVSFLIFQLRKVLDKFISVSNTFKNLLFLFLLGVIPILFSEYLSLWLGFSGNWVATLLVTPLSPVVILVMSLLNLTRQDRKSILEALENLSIAPEFESLFESEAENAFLATYLHNSLQSELLALSKQLEDAAKEEDPVKSAELLQRVSSMVTRSIIDDYAKFAESPLKRLESVVDSWAGILEIEVDISQLELANKRLHRIIVQTIEEVATNAVRHGNANRLNVTLTISNDDVTLRFHSNGTNELVRGAGQGSAWLDKIATFGWKIERNRDGTFLTVSF